MTFSLGQDFFNELLKSSDKRTHNDEKAISQTYHLQERLNYFWKNNDKPVLLQSQKYSGMSDLAGKSEPLGGQINWQQCGITNAPGSCTGGCSDEYPFWGPVTHTKQNPGIVLDSKEKTIGKKLNDKENFTVLHNKENFNIDKKENFNGTDPMVWIIIILVAIVTIIIGVLILLSHLKGK